MIDYMKKKCLRCGYEWLSVLDRPKSCPDCKSRMWDEIREPVKAEVQHRPEAEKP